jgi:hypothetical protein
MGPRCIFWFAKQWILATKLPNNPGWILAVVFTDSKQPKVECGG